MRRDILRYFFFDETAKVGDHLLALPALGELGLSSE